jgi:hypothetical protein
VSDEKVSRHAHPKERDVTSASYLDGNDRQGNGDAPPALKYLVEVAIRRVVIIILLSSETLFLKQELDNSGKRVVRDFRSKTIDL